jgi:hypothetical protein
MPGGTFHVAEFLLGAEAALAATAMIGSAIKALKSERLFNVLFLYLTQIRTA